MSSRADLQRKAEEAVRSLEAHYPDPDPEQYAFSVLYAVMPLITEPQQLYSGVPNGSILIVEIQAGARALRWEDGHLHGNLRADQMPMTPDWVISRYGPLTVVWMP